MRRRRRAARRRRASPSTRSQPSSRHVGVSRCAACAGGPGGTRGFSSLSIYSVSFSVSRVWFSLGQLKHEGSHMCIRGEMHRSQGRSTLAPTNTKGPPHTKRALPRSPGCCSSLPHLRAAAHGCAVTAAAVGRAWRSRPPGPSAREVAPRSSGLAVGGSSPAYTAARPSPPGAPRSLGCPGATRPACCDEGQGGACGHSCGRQRTRLRLLRWRRRG